MTMLGMAGCIICGGCNGAAGTGCAGRSCGGTTTGGAEARVVGVVQLVVVATLAVAGLALGAEEPQQLGYHGQQHRSCRMVLDTKCHQIIQSSLFVV